MKPIHRNSNLYYYSGFIEFVLRDLELWHAPIDITWKYINSRKFSGSCGWGEWLGRGRNRIYYTHIYLDCGMIRFRSESAYETIAHELRHMWQMYHKHLTSPGGNKVIWHMDGKRQAFSVVKANRTFPKLAFIPYDECPQEIDAHAYEARVLEKMKNYTARILIGPDRVYRVTEAQSLEDAIRYFKENLMQGEMLVQVRGNVVHNTFTEHSDALNYRKE